jgi:hypothetical protein
MGALQERERMGAALQIGMLSSEGMGRLPRPTRQLGELSLRFGPTA